MSDQKDVTDSVQEHIRRSDARWTPEREKFWSDIDRQSAEALDAYLEADLREFERRKKEAESSSEEED